MEKRVMKRYEASDIIRVAMVRKKETQTSLACKMGMKQNTVSAAINRNRISLIWFVKVLNALGYEVRVVNRETGEAEFEVKLDEEFSENS